MLYANIDLPETYGMLAKHPIWEHALGWLKRMPADQPEGVVQFDGDRFFVNVHSYATQARETCEFESHRRYIDLQYCISGGELIDYCRTDRLVPRGPYDAARDFSFHQAPAIFSVLRMEMKDFAIFFPADGHRPKVADGHHPSVRKLVIKIDQALL